MLVDEIAALLDDMIEDDIGDDEDIEVLLPLFDIE